MIRKSSLVALLIILFPVAHLLASLTDSSIAKFCSYYDEFIGSIAVIYVTLLFLQKKLCRSDKIIFGILLVLTAIGLASNVVSGLISNSFAIVVDTVALWKPLACYLAFKEYAVNYQNNMVRTLLTIAKITIIFVAAVSIIGEFVDIGVMGSTVYGGIKSFRFFWNNSLQTGWLLCCCILILSAANISKQKFYRYLFISIIPLVLTTTSTTLCWVVIELLLICMLKEGRVFKKRYIVLLAVILIAACFSDFSAYFLNETAPRAKLIQGGITTANEYFPLGSGFATYGSEMASRYYSKIYIHFGWTNSWGLGILNHQFLNDNFFASIVGQFGWIGLVLYFICLIQVFNTINTTILSKFERVSAISTVLTIAASMLGSASGKSVMGVCAFSVLGIIAAKVQRINASRGVINPKAIPFEYKETTSPYSNRKYSLNFIQKENHAFKLR